MVAISVIILSNIGPELRTSSSLYFVYLRYISTFPTISKNLFALPSTNSSGNFCKLSDKWKNLTWELLYLVCFIWIFCLWHCPYLVLFQIANIQFICGTKWDSFCSKYLDLIFTAERWNRLTHPEVSVDTFFRFHISLTGFRPTFHMKNC